MKLQLLLAGLALAAIGCGSTVAEPSGHAFSAELLVGDTLRTYEAYVPAAAQTSDGMPLVVLFHGARGDGAGARAGSGLDALADEHGFVVAYPDAIAGYWAEGCGCVSADQAGVNDTGFVRALIDTLAAEYNVDRQRVYGAGYSQGGFFSHRLACEMSDVFAALATVAGPMSGPVAGSCEPAEPIAMLSMHGTADLVIRYEGQGDGIWELLGARETAAAWAALNGCVGEPATSELPDEADDGTRVYRDIYSTCEDGAEVRLYTVEGGQHYFHMSLDISTPQTIVEFFLAHER